MVENNNISKKNNNNNSSDKEEVENSIHFQKDLWSQLVYQIS